jgi:hypothetical protein
VKHPVKRFKSMEVALKELAPFILDGKHLESGRGFKSMNDMRSREALANWLMCAVLNHIGQREMSFSSDPVGGDGVLHDAKTEQTFLTEHVMVSRHQGGEGSDAHKLVLDAVTAKNEKGKAAYASGKILIVFLDSGAGEWFPNRIARSLPQPLHFEEVWIVGLQKVENGSYVYGVTSLDLSNGDAPIYLVQINPNFDGWNVERQQ